MISNLFFRSVLIAFALILISGFARAEVAQCNDTDGTVLFTDKACATGETVELALFTNRGSIAAANPGKTAAARSGGDAAMAKSESANRRQSPDMTTVLAARVSTDSSYQPWSMLRREQLAELALLAQP